MQPIMIIENDISDFSYKALSSDTWNDFVSLFGKNGACGGCWCMYWRLRHRDYEQQKGEGNKHAMYRMVQSGLPLGIIAYSKDVPISWCSIAPREQNIRLENSRTLKRIDDKPVWSITCLFVNKIYRKKGISAMLIEHAVQFAFDSGISTVEAYPVIPKKEKMPDVFAYTGIYSTFIKSGFKEAARFSDYRVIVRIQNEKVNK